MFDKGKIPVKGNIVKKDRAKHNQRQSSCSSDGTQTFTLTNNYTVFKSI